MNRSNGFHLQLLVQTVLLVYIIGLTQVGQAHCTGSLLNKLQYSISFCQCLLLRPSISTRTISIHPRFGEFLFCVYGDDLSGRSALERFWSSMDRGWWLPWDTWMCRFSCLSYAAQLLRFCMICVSWRRCIQLIATAASPWLLAPIECD